MDLHDIFLAANPALARLGQPSKRGFPRGRWSPECNPGGASRRSKHNRSSVDTLSERGRVADAHYDANEGPGWAKRDKQIVRRSLSLEKPRRPANSRIALRDNEEQKELLLQLGEFDPGRLEDRNIGVRVFPKREEFLVGNSRRVHRT